jgi:NADH-quinone oxidoreductase subunit L
VTEFLAQHAYMIAVLPVIGFGIVIFSGRRTPLEGAAVPIAALSLSFLWSLGCLGYLLGGGEPLRRGFEWAVAGSSFVFSYTVDAPAVAMLVMVSFVATLVTIYSTGYMHGDADYSRFFAFLSLFTASMLGLVLASNLVFLFICWELVGLMSYLLIGFWYEKPEAARACKKAFLTTRIGDAGITIAILALFVQTRTLDLNEIFVKVAAGAIPKETLFLISLGLFAGAVGKSAQFPLHVWLPDAMEGPTPVSALIHAATMVAAGVWMVFRMSPIIGATAGMGVYDATVWIAWIGGFTAIFAATIAIAQDDIKRVLAYSTISQLGYMMLGLGVGAYFAGFFHLLTHAFFKALLFLGSGSVIVGCHHEQDMKKMGGLAKAMPITFATFALGTLALAGVGIPGWLGFSGFHSKEMILVAAWTQARPLAWMGLAGAFLTPFYMTRCVCLTFFGDKPRDHHVAEHARENRANMTVPLILLAVLAVCAGWWGPQFRAWLDEGYGFQRAAVHSTAVAAEPAETPEALAEEHDAEVTVGWTAFSCVVTAILAGLLLWGRGPKLVEGWVERNRALRLLRLLLARKYFIDELYLGIANVAIRGMIVCAWFDLHVIDKVFVRGWAWLTLQAKSAMGWVDTYVVDKVLVHALPTAAYVAGALLQLAQTGTVQLYLLVTALGGVALIAASLFADSVLQVFLVAGGGTLLVGVLGACVRRVRRKAVSQ